MKSYLFVLFVVLGTVYAEENNIAVAGANSQTISQYLAAVFPGSAVDYFSAAPAGATLKKYDTIFLVRTTGNDDIANWVKGGGRLITEWDAATWYEFGIYSISQS